MKKKFLRKSIINKQKIYPILMILGASILLFRTLMLLTVENGWETLVAWVIAFTFIEMLIDFFCVAFSFLWLTKANPNAKKIALRLGATIAILHAFRVLVYVIGRVGPFYNFDLKPQYRNTQNVEIFSIYLASLLSILGVIGVIIIWRITKKGKKQ